MEELKKEEKNDMAKKKTFQEYTQEAFYEIEKTEAALKQAKLEKEQAEHRIQRSLNYLDTQKKKKRKARTHLLIQKGAAIEAICKDTKYLTEAEFYQLMDELLHDSACKFLETLFRNDRNKQTSIEYCVLWLERFGTWENFVKQNCMESFVDKKGVPKRFFKNHSLNYPIPKTIKEFEEFFETVNECIANRGKAIINIFIQQGYISTEETEQLEEGALEYSQMKEEQQLLFLI